MAVRTAGVDLPDTYFDLVRAFPLVHIRDDAHLDDALGMIEELLASDPDEGTQAYLDALTDLVEVYEAEHVRIPDASGADVLRALMESNGLGQTALAKRTGIAQSTLSAILGGRRKLTSNHIVTLAGFFNVRPAVFLPAT